MNDVEVLSTRISENNNNKQKSQMKVLKPLQSLDPVTLNYMMQAQIEHEHLHTAQSQHQYQQQKLPEQRHPDAYRPVRRKRRKSHQQRKQFDHHPSIKDANTWPTHFDLNNSNFIQPTKSLSNMAVGRGTSKFYQIKTNFNEISDARTKIGHHQISSMPSSNSNGNGSSILELNSWNNWQSNNTRNVNKVPFNVSTSSGGTQMVIVSTSRSVSAFTDRMNHMNKKQNTKHRKETIKQRAAQTSNGQSQLKNKYNIDYDNKFEDEYEIIMKDE